MKKIMKKSLGLTIIALALPVVTFAQSGLFDILARVRGLVAALVPLIIGFAVLYFLWGVLKYVTAKESDAQKEATSIMVMGVIVLFVMVSVWGLVALLQDTFDIDSGEAPTNVRLIP
jgi:uncharacterized membrane protein